MITIARVYIDLKVQTNEMLTESVDYTALKLGW